MLSLRTQLVVKAARTACDMVITFGVQLDALTQDQLSTAAMKMCAQAKRIVAMAGAEVLETAIYTLQTTRPMGAVQAALTDRNKDLRVIAAHMFLLMMQHCAFSRAVVEGVRDVLQRGLGDAAPAVREAMRLAYWAWKAHVQPSVAERSVRGAPREARGVVRRVCDVDRVRRRPRRARGGDASTAFCCHSTRAPSSWCARARRRPHSIRDESTRRGAPSPGPPRAAVRCLRVPGPREPLASQQHRPTSASAVPRPPLPVRNLHRRRARAPSHRHRPAP